MAAAAAAAAAPPAAAAAAAAAAVARSAPSRLLVVRHGETVWNAEGRLQGQLDVELNETGRRQAAETAAALKKLAEAGALGAIEGAENGEAGGFSTVDAIVCSDLARARQTADAIAEVFPGAARFEDPGMREVNCGSLQGKITAAEPEAQRLVASTHQAWLSGDLARQFPEGGECCAEVMARGMRALRTAAGRGACVVVVAHGGVIKWSSLGIALFDGMVPAGPADIKVSAEDMAQEKAQAVLTAPVRNCSCSTMSFDPAVDRLRTWALFKSLTGDSSARDDTG